MCKKLAFFLLIVYISHVYTDMQEEADKACKERPRFYEETTKVVNAIGAALGMVVGDGTVFNKAHVIPSDAMRTMICGEFAGFQDDDEISEWKNGISDLLTQLHTIDPEWKDLNTLQSDEVWPAFVKHNNDNKKKCNVILGKFEDDDTRPDLEIAKNLAELYKCLNSSPANLRVGFSRTNSAVSNALDPVLARLVENDDEVTEEDLTSKSKKYQDDYGENYGLVFKEYADGGIMTSDQPYRG